MLNAESQVYSSCRKLTRAVLDMLVAQLKLKTATGELGEPYLRAANALLEMETRSESSYGVWALRRA